MEITRFVHDDVEYVIGADLIDINGEKVPSPYIRASNKKAIKKRGIKFSDKKDNLYKRINIRSPILFYRKAFDIFENFLKNYNYVTFQAWDDDKEKRTRVYIKALEKMGFIFDYLYICPWEKSYKEYVMCREGYELKKKEYNKIFKSMYGYWYQDETGEWIEEK